jgi:hypothetical protein
MGVRPGAVCTVRHVFENEIFLTKPHPCANSKTPPCATRWWWQERGNGCAVLQDGELNSPQQVERKNDAGAMLDLFLLIEDVFGDQEGGHGVGPAGIEGELGHEFDEFVSGDAVVEGALEMEG